MPGSTWWRRSRRIRPDLIGRKAVFFAGLGIFTIAYLGFGLTTQAWLVVVLFVVYGAFQGIFRAVGKAMATDMVPEQLRASSVGLFSSVVGVAT